MHATVVEKAKLGLTIIIGNNRLNATFKATQRIRRGATRAPFASDVLLDAQAELLPPRLSGPGAGGSGGHGDAASPGIPPVAFEDRDDPDCEPGSASHDSFKQQ
jgi:hypothetical protein